MVIKYKMMQENRFNEISFLKEWTIEILDFFLKIESQQEWFFKEYIKQVLVAYEKCDFRGIKCAFNDVNDAAFDLDSKQYKELNHILYLKFGISLDNQNKKVIKKIKTILKRGHIKNIDEYRLVSERVERIYADDDKKEEVETLNNLLADFETKHKPNNDQ